jgi:hypothetical protein
MPKTAFTAILATVRQTHAAHASALDELERTFAAETVSFGSSMECSSDCIINQAKLALDVESLVAERDAMVKRAKEASERERAAIAEEREAVGRDRANLEAKLAKMTAVQPSSESSSYKHEEEESCFLKVIIQARISSSSTSAVCGSTPPGRL